LMPSASRGNRTFCPDFVGTAEPASRYRIPNIPQLLFLLS
jgi:hypothetical protein